MKFYAVLLIIAFSLTTNIYSQVEFSSHTITRDALSARSVYSVDVDGDGDMDVLFASVSDDKIAWYANLSPVGVRSISSEILTEFRLSQNYPNAFNPNATINFQI